MADAGPVAATPLLLTARLRLVAADVSMAAALLDFHERNRLHLAPWDPPTEPGFFTEAVQAQRLHDAAAAFAAGTGFRYLLQPIGDPRRVIGSINFSNIVRSAFQSCNLGYALDQQFEGQALMTEALRCAIGEVFSPRIDLHRIQAAYRPENWRSADYLFIDGLWRVHRLVALLNKGFVPPAAWLQPG